MYNEYIKKYQEMIKEYNHKIAEATLQNKKYVKVICAIFVLLIIFSFMLPEPFFKVPLTFPLLAFGVSGILSAPFVKTYCNTLILIKEMQDKIKSLTKDLEEMKELNNKREKTKDIENKHKKNTSNSKNHQGSRK